MLEDMYSMNRLFQWLIGAILLQFALSCPPEGGFFPIRRDANKTLAKRGYRIPKADGVWPEGRITYCFADDTAKVKLGDVVRKAWEMWVIRGTNPQLKMKEGKPDYCATANRNSYLQISYNENGVLTTTPGYAAGFAAEGPSMNLDPRDGFASGSGMGNVAHEIGHAWGLLHEHQRPSLWTEEYGGSAQTNTFHFYCQNLKDYATLAASNDMTRPCRSMVAANSINFFTATNILPDNRGNDMGAPGVVDWDSIMIYGSTAGAATQNGQFLITLTKADGSTFGYNTYPSESDIDTLNSLYEDELSGQKMGRFAALWSKANPKHGVFYKRNKESSCS